MLRGGLSCYRRLYRSSTEPSQFYIRRRGVQTSAHAGSHDEPIRILFCGADPFSIESLRALHAEFEETGSNISSIDVVTKNDKKSGRGLKVLKSPPIKPVALELGLPLHQIDTFTGWNPPTYGSEDINLVVAVSFGLLIPQRILSSCKYGGLNVHPSMLPDLRGAAPIQWTIINGRSHTGMSLQTLHPSKFDEGVILDQTPYPGLEIPDRDSITFKQLRELLAPIGAKMLVNALRKRLYLPGSRPVDAQQSQVQVASSLAPRIQDWHKAVDFQSMTLEEILRRNRAIPKLFALSSAADRIRLVFGTDMRASKIEEISTELQSDCMRIPVGVPYTIIDESGDIFQSTAPININVNGRDPSVRLVVPTITVAGSPTACAAAAASRNHLFRPPVTVGKFKIYEFEAPIGPADITSNHNG